MAQGSSMDMSRLSTGEKIVLGAAGAYFVWAFLPIWYNVSGDSKNGLTGVTLVAWILAIVAVADIILRSMMGMKFNLPVKPGQLHVAIAGLALILTVIGLVAKPTGSGVGWGLFVGIIIALAWVYGAYMMYSAPEAAPMSPPTDAQGDMTL
jgi:hypothetical protein